MEALNSARALVDDRPTQRPLPLEVPTRKIAGEMRNKPEDTLRRCSNTYYLIHFPSWVKERKHNHGTSEGRHASHPGREEVSVPGCFVSGLGF